MLTREEIKARLLEHRPNICNDLRADESEEFKNFTDEELMRPTSNFFAIK